MGCVGLFRVMHLVPQCFHDQTDQRICNGISSLELQLGLPFKTGAASLVPPVRAAWRVCIIFLNVAESRAHRVAAHHSVVRIKAVTLLADAPDGLACLGNQDSCIPEWFLFPFVGQ